MKNRLAPANFQIGLSLSTSTLHFLFDTSLFSLFEVMFNSEWKQHVLFKNCRTTLAYDADEGKRK